MSKLAFIKEKILGAVPFFLICAFLCNFVLSCVVYRSSHPRYIYETHVTTNYVHSVVTNFLPVSVVDSSNSVSSVVSPSKPSIPSSESHRFPYEYFIFSGRPSMRYYGKVYHEGEVCSLGLILRIFPDKVYFHNGDVLLNDLPPRRSETSLSKRLNYE